MLVRPVERRGLARAEGTRAGHDARLGTDAQSGRRQERPALQPRPLPLGLSHDHADPDPRTNDRDVTTLGPPTQFDSRAQYLNAAQANLKFPSSFFAGFGAVTLPRDIGFEPPLAWRGAGEASPLHVSTSECSAA